MANLVILNQHIGPLPLTTSFNSPSDAPATLIVYGSVWSQTANTHIGISVVLDGKVVGSAQIFSNTTAVHRAVVPTYIPVQLSIGAHTLVLQALNGQTISDLNDFFTAVLSY